MENSHFCSIKHGDVKDQFVVVEDPGRAVDIENHKRQVLKIWRREETRVWYGDSRPSATSSLGVPPSEVLNCEELALGLLVKDRK